MLSNEAHQASSGSRLRIFIVLMVLLFGMCVQAKDLTSRLGVGYTDQFSIDMPSLAVRYYPSARLGVSGAIGVDTEEDQSKFGFMVKVYRVIFMEDNMNFYMGTGAALISREQENSTTNRVENDSGFELSGFAGGEFFLPGLDSLGFSFEAGIGVTSISSEVRFRTIGEHPMKAGIIFYF